MASANSACHNGVEKYVRWKWCFFRKLNWHVKDSFVSHLFVEGCI